MTHRLVIDPVKKWAVKQDLRWRCECGYVLGEGRERFLAECPVFGKEAGHEPTSDILLDPAVVDSDRMLCATGNDMGAEGERDRDVDIVRDHRDQDTQTQLVML